eukprot:SAG31_NODE_2770_length_5116_cov_3.834164_6_plen_188_part_00
MSSTQAAAADFRSPTSRPQVRGYFLVFVQLFEKYGTLIERYTALIEKVPALIGFAGANVSGIDIWQGGLDQAAKREYYQSLTKVDLQAAPYPFDDDTFDAVVSVGVLTYLRPDSACLSEFIRVTKPGGIICYSNRTDKLDLWAPVEKALEDSGQWALVGRSERLPYLPKNSEFNTETEIVISTWRKI